MSDITIPTEKAIAYLEINANGQVEVISINGEGRIAESEGVVFFGEAIRSINNSSGKVIFFNEDVEVIYFGPGDIIYLNEEVYHLNGLDALAQDASTEAALLQAAILEGVDPTLIQDPTAAGEGIEEEGTLGSTPTLYRNQSSFIFENPGLLNSDDGFSYLGNSEYNLPDPHTSNASDQDGQTGQNSQSNLAVTSGNSAPVAQNANVEVLEDSSFLGQIEAFDADTKDQGNLTFTVLNPTAGFSLISSGAFLFDAEDYDSLSP